MQILTRIACTIALFSATSCATSSLYRFEVSRDAFTQRRVWRLGQHLAAVAAREEERARRVVWRFAAIEQHPFGASASYDGAVGIDSGLAAVLANDELACVMGHEIGHVVREHSTRGNTATGVGAGLVLVGTIATIPFAPWWVPLTAFVGGDTIREVSVAAYSRSLEEEADRFAVWLTIAAGYRADACERFFTRARSLLAHEQSWIAATFFATHPDFDDRVANVRDEAMRYAR